MLYIGNAFSLGMVFQSPIGTNKTMEEELEEDFMSSFQSPIGTNKTIQL